MCREFCWLVQASVLCNLFKCKAIVVNWRKKLGASRTRVEKCRRDDRDAQNKRKFGQFKMGEELMNDSSNCYSFI